MTAFLPPTPFRLPRPAAATQPQPSLGVPRARRCVRPAAVRAALDNEDDEDGRRRHGSSSSGAPLRPSQPFGGDPSDELRVLSMEEERVRSGGSGSGPSVPSGVLLLLSSVLAIATVGCVFELSSGHPQQGFVVTSAILAAAGPGFVTMFVLAIRKGQEEADED